MSETLPASPYKGLTPFADTAIDATLFFGRELDVEIVCANVVASPLTVLYGPSGVGKSSLLAAAVARQLRDLPERPVVVLFSAWSDRPLSAIAEGIAAAAGVEPTESLATAVDRAVEARGQVYLLLDQAEEYFLYHPGGDAFEQELASVLRGPAGVNVLISLREDALAKLDRFKASIPGILDNYLRLDRLSREAGRAAVEQPLTRWHGLGGDPVEIEPALTAAVLDQVAAGRIRSGLGGSGAVEEEAGEERIEAPYLQLVMERLWEVERQQGSSTLQAATLERLGGAAQIVAAHLERAMGTLTPAQQAIASALFRQLVTPSGAKIAHAAPDLAGYAGVPDEEALAVLEALAARRILRPGDDGSYEIYHDVLAAPILAWRARFVQAQALVVAHQRSRRLALVAAVSIVGVLAMALVTVFALVQRSNARSDAQAAHARELDAAAVALGPTDPELGLLLARDSAVLSPSATAEDVLRDALRSSRLRTVVDVGAPLLAAATVDRAIVTASNDGNVLVAGHSGAKTTTASGRPAIDASIARGGDVVLTGGDGRLRVVSHGEVRLVPKVEQARGADISSSALLAAVRSAGLKGEPDRRVRVVGLRAGDTLLEVDHGAPATAAALSAAGDLLATGGSDHLVRLWHVPDGRLLRVYGGHVGTITTIEFSTRGTLLATGATDGIGRVWGNRDGRPVSILAGHSNYLTDIGFSRDGTRVVTASLDGTARTWKTTTGAALATCAAATDAMASASYTRSKGEIVTASLDGVARTWDVVVQPGLRVVANLHAPVSRVEFVADAGALRATAGARSYRIALPHGPAVDVGPAGVRGIGVAGPGGSLRAVPHGKSVTVTRGDGHHVRARRPQG